MVNEAVISSNHVLVAEEVSQLVDEKTSEVETETNVHVTV